MKNWKTTLFGILAACSSGAAMYPDPIVQKIAGVLTAIFTGLLGLSAKDHDVTGGTKQ